MADKIIQVNVTSTKSQRVSVSPGNVQNEISATPDTSQYYSNLAKNWAIASGLILNEDYSSKHYAKESANSASSAKNYADVAQATYTNVQNVANEALTDIETAKVDAVGNITTARDESIASVEAKSDEVLSTVNAGISEINNTKTTILQDIEFVADGEKEEIRDLADDIKENASDIINRVSLTMFDTILKDHLLTYEESKGLALQGTWVYKEAIAGERYGYPDFYNKVVEEFEQATPRNFVYTDTISWTVYDAPNGHMYIDVSEKSKIDTLFEAQGMAWYYILDRANKRVFLPRNNWFEQMSMTQAGKWAVAGLPNITGQTALKHGSRVPGFDSFSGAIQAYDIARGGDANAYVGNQAPFGFKLDASLSSPIYGRSSTVQPNAVKKLLYICVGNTVSDTSWVDVVTQVEDGVKDLEDKTLEGLERLKQSSTALTQSQITNCLLEVPQNIKLELADGVLTLKAGSVVTVPNGFEADGTTPKFDYVTIESDITDTADTPRQAMIWCRKYDGNYLISSPIPSVYCYSGSTAPTSFYGDSIAIWYDTNTNLIKYTENGGTSWDNQGHSLPLAIVTETTTSYTSIDQVFNGMGYIGSTIWVDKGVKVLIPNGRNGDGSLNNIEYTVSSIRTRTYTGANNNASIGILYDNTIIPLVKVGIDVKYNEQENLIRVTSNGINWGGCYTGLVSLDSTGRVTSFKVPQPFRAVDYNDFNNTPHIIETYRNGTSWYRVWSDGWCEQGGVVSNMDSTNTGQRTVNLLKSYKDTNYNVQVFWTNAATQAPSCAWIGCLRSRQVNSFIINKDSKTYITEYTWETKGYVR